MPSNPAAPTLAGARSVPLQVLHLSMPRTGSVSMMAAYKILGLTTYHGFNFVERTRDQTQWERAIDAKFYGKGRPFEREDFDAFLGEFGVLSDVPAIGFSEEFIEMYPDAKVILVDRDIEKWYHSYSTYVIAANYTWPALFMRYFLEYFLTARPATLMNKLDFAMLNASDRAGLERNAQDTYRKHYDKIRRLVPKERLLEYKLGSGWQPLCEFLGKEVPGPEVEFPFLNESAEFAKFIKRVQAEILWKGLRSMFGSSFVMIPLVLGVSAWVWI
ncbi:hypothetical protein ACJ72_04253 [Emergomyces africanus]|uniref:Sulfotransferase domain-containing protein n=1 Tax=Emergomyces africanus TaxID=1955775 RepID=A0A1B7NX92_9EURO|nr:hypothetical protein ACJ72_04253 [Emergomyces africanus]